jgi:hypothetical protein
VGLFQAPGFIRGVSDGCVTSGTAWRFLKLEGQTVTIDLMDYPLPPVDRILSIFLWMLR